MIYYLLFIVNIFALYIVIRYSNTSTDIYNHLAFIKSLDNKYIISQSAIRERNTYPPFIHIIYKYVEKAKCVKYLSLIVLFAIEISIYLYFLSDYGYYNSVIGVLIAILSTSLFIDLRSYNARIFGVLFYTMSVMISLEVISGAYNYIFLFPFVTFLLIITSRFGHQILVLTLLPFLFFTQAYNLIVTYVISITVIYALDILNSRAVIKGHVFHLGYYYKKGMEFWDDKRYWREVSGSNSSTLKSLNFKRLLIILLKEPISLLSCIYLLSIYYFEVELSNVDILLILSCVLYFFVALFNRLDNFIGDSYRYWEYISPVLSISILSQIGDNQNIVSLILLIITFLVCSYTVFTLSKNERKLNNQNRLYVDKEINDYIDSLPEKSILTLPISLSNKFGLETNKKYFYGYTYFGFWFLDRTGMTPYFRFDSNLLSKKYIKIVIFDENQIDEKVISCLVKRYDLSLIKYINGFRVFRKNA